MRVSHSRRGFTLTEIAVVLGIVGLILGGIWTAAASVYRAKKINQEVEEIQAIVQNVRSIYALRNTIAAGCMQTLLINAGAFPSDMVTPGAPADGTCGTSIVHNPWGETVDVGSQTGWDGVVASPSNFEILVAWPVQNMSSAECVSVLEAIVTSRTAAAGLVGVGGSGIITTQNIAAIPGPSYFQACGTAAPGGHFTVQYSLK